VSWRAGAEKLFGEPLPEDPWPVAAKKLLTEREQALYQRLLSLYPDHKIFIQVALSQLVDVDRKHPDRQAIRKRYKQLVADFVLCRSDLSVVAVIELDDRSHTRPDRQYADARKNKALADAGIRLVRVPAGRSPSEEDLRALINADGTANEGIQEETVLSLLEPVKTYDEAPMHAWRDGPNAESLELKRIVLKLVGVAILVLGGWFIFGYVLPGAIKLAFQPLAAPQARAAVAPPRSVPVARPQISTAPLVSGPSAAELADRRRAILQEATEQQKQKDLAWAAFYSAPTSCEHPAAWNAQVECGNQYMRAKKVFEEKWAAEHPGGGSGAEFILDNRAVGATHK
jgi:hypothetical protein